MLQSPFSAISLRNEEPGPLWRQLLLQIMDLLDQGTLTAGMSLPPERDMAEALGVSRITIKRAYDELRKLGVLGGRGREGSLVRGALPQRVQPTMGRLKGFTEEMQELGISASTKLLRLQVVTDRRIASIFGLPSGAQLLHVARIRLGNDQPMTRELAWYNLTAAPRLEAWDGAGSAYAWLKSECSINLTEAEQTIEAVLSTPEEDKAFGFSTPQPCLLLKRRTYANSPAPLLVEYVEGTFRGDAYAYRTKLIV